ncbi:SGNH hydrolase-type esterase domain-containing protein [Chytriomyces sp. MP71]|nr:SGNH hydrolase-type esterase domain-containing protein [Chytriomyces sp. MP71]
MMKLDPRAFTLLAILSIATALTCVVLSLRESAFKNPSHPSHPIPPPSQFADDPPIPDLSYDQVIFLGDSLTDLFNPHGGWSNLLARDYSPAMDVHFRARSGFNSFWLKAALRSFLHTLAPEKVKLVTLLIGTNDSKDPIDNGSVPVDLYSRSLLEILDIVHVLHPQAKILVMTPPPLSKESVWGVFSFTRVKEYRDACAATVFELLRDSVGWAKGTVALLDSWDVFIPNQEYDEAQFQLSSLDELFVDGVHFSQRGNDMFYEAVKAKILDEWPQLAADRVSWKIPMPHEGFVRAEIGREAEALKIIVPENS